MRGATPSGRRLVMPPEFGPHERMLVAWPARASLWGAHLAAATDAYRATVLAVAEFEPVTVVARPGDGRAVAQACAGGTRFPVDVVELPIDDSWVRDTGPLVVTGPDGRRVGVDFTFNGWGRKFEPFAADAAPRCSRSAAAASTASPCRCPVSGRARGEHSPARPGAAGHARVAGPGRAADPPAAAGGARAARPWTPSPSPVGRPTTSRPGSPGRPADPAAGPDPPAH